jgi:hypothetical protein
MKSVGSFTVTNLKKQVSKKSNSVLVGMYSTI